MSIHFALLLIILLFELTITDYEKEREEMVSSQIEARGIRNPDVLRAMRKVERHLFVPEEYRKYAYEDRPLPIGYGQTISQPYIVAFMTEVIAPQKEHRILEIGTGSGYQAAVLAEIVKEVFTIEIIEPLATGASVFLEDLHYSNVSVRAGDGYFGWEEHAPFDAILVTAAPDFVPPALIGQLKRGGKMVIPVGRTAESQYLKLITKTTTDTITQNLFPVRFVPFLREAEK